MRGQTMLGGGIGLDRLLPTPLKAAVPVSDPADLPEHVRWCIEVERDQRRRLRDDVPDTVLSAAATRLATANKKKGANIPPRMTFMTVAPAQFAAQTFAC
jgi:hypothetical protein